MACLFITLLRRAKFIDFFGNSNSFSKKFVFSGFLGLSQFHLIPASVTPTFLRFYSSEANETWHACLSHHCAGTIFFYFFEIRIIFRKIAFFRIFRDLVNFTAYRHQFITIYSYTIHLRSIKLGMLVYHIIAQNQIYWFFGNSNYFSKKFVFSGFLGLGQFHLIPASLLQLIAVLFILTGSLIIAQGPFCLVFWNLEYFSEF